VITIANPWFHLVRFDREARGFDRVVERIPFGARLVALTWDANGAVMRTKPYWHFGAYAQARRGGLLAQSFPRMFWNIPVRMRADAHVPVSPVSLEAKPYLFDYQTFGFAYDHVLVRTGETKGRDRFRVFPYQLVFEAPLWQVWRALPSPGAAPSAAVPSRASPSAPQPTSARVAGPNLVLLSIDTLRADALGSYGRAENPTPNLDRLAREGVRFSSAYSTSSWTAPSIASLMTGLYPTQHGVRHGFIQKGAVKGQEELPPDSPVLTELLHARGYRTFGIVANGHLEGRFGFARGFDRYECLGFRNGPLVLEHLQTWLTEIKEDREAPYFLWVHLLDPHSPYLGFPPYLERIWGWRLRHPDLEHVTPADEYDAKKLSGDRLEYVKMLYASEVNYADFVVGEILGRLGVRKAPRQQSDRGTFIVALSDHGEEFSEHGRFGHGHTLFEESVHVPLIMRWPDGAFANTQVSVPVSLVDIVPTLAAALDLSDSSHTVASDGESLLPLASRAAASTPRALFAELSRGRQRVMARMGDLKLIRDPLESRSTLFDLARDPLEKADLASTRSAETAALEARITRVLGARPAREAAVKPLDEHEVRALKAMGYVQ
jgi:arylsulfatase A-like enzyme